MSSSRIIDGGLTCFPHPFVWSVWEDCSGPVNVDLSLSTKDGGAKMTAVLDIVAELDTPKPEAGVTAAPTGKRGAAGFAFGGGFLRMGANANAADHPEGSMDPTREIAWMTVL